MVEQNRDAQLRMLLVNEGTADPSRLISVLHYDGTPITARFIIGEIAEKVAVLKVTPLRKAGDANDLPRPNRNCITPSARQERARAARAATTRARSPPVRRLRARFDQRGDHPVRASSCDLPPHRIAKLSGIGCSSKTPTYFLGSSHGFNSVHGRMPSVLTGANLANREPDLPRRVRRRRLAPRSVSASSRTRSGAA